MTEPVPDPPPAPMPVSPLTPLAPPAPTQVRHPWRATVRTGLAIGLGVASTLPDVLATLHIESTVVGGQVLAVALGATRVMALPKVNDLLTNLGLGAEPKS